MNFEQILKKATKKAIKNGWNQQMVDGTFWLDLDITSAERKQALLRNKANIIFSHGFAKAFWGEAIDFHSNKPQWQLVLRNMVLEEEPLKYLERFL